VLTPLYDDLFSEICNTLFEISFKLASYVLTDQQASEFNSTNWFCTPSQNVKFPVPVLTVSVYTSKDNLLEALSNDRNMRREHNADYIFGNTLNTVRD